jgi:hypothetical protein
MVDKRKESESERERERERASQVGSKFALVA